jgi:hypothetical protein
MWLASPGLRFRRDIKVVGTDNWINEGHTIETADIPSIPILTSDVYEWAPGGFFVVHRPST